MITGPSSASGILLRRKRSSIARWCLIVGTVVVIAIGVMAIQLVRNWPFTQQAVTVALQDRFARRHLLSAGIHSGGSQFSASRAQESSTADHGPHSYFARELRRPVQCAEARGSR